jgi:hypothetical protein
MVLSVFGWPDIAVRLPVKCDRTRRVGNLGGGVRVRVRVRQDSWSAGRPAQVAKHMLGQPRATATRASAKAWAASLV